MTYIAMLPKFWEILQPLKKCHDNELQKPQAANEQTESLTLNLYNLFHWFKKNAG